MPGKTKEQEFNEEMERQQDMANKAYQAGKDPNQPPGAMPPNPADALTTQEQTVLNTVKANVPVSPVAAAPSQGQCPQCNIFHPPLAPGEKCPNAPVAIEGISEAEINGIVVKVKDILASQLEQKGIKDLDKFAGGLIVELMKYCEGYKE